ncbi:MAG: cupin domain-containing protein [Desulfobacteraceae bacterium]|jgi:uncharacterized protein
MMTKSDLMKPTNLQAHPEGGRFQEVFRSEKKVSTQNGATRSAMTHIYFSLGSGEVSTFHTVASDEVWNLYRGTGLNLYLWDGSEKPPLRITLSAGEDCFCHVVPAGMWMAAEPMEREVLMGCTVAPGFEFSDFHLMDADSEDAKRLVGVAPEMARFISDR